MDFYVNRRNGSPAHLGAGGINFTDSHGRKFRYDADRNGRVQVDNPEHARIIEQSAKLDGGVIQKATGNSFRRTQSKYCRKCIFTAYKWQSVCPKCGGELELPEGENQ